MKYQPGVYFIPELWGREKCKCIYIKKSWKLHLRQDWAKNK